MNTLQSETAKATQLNALLIQKKRQVGDKHGRPIVEALVRSAEAICSDYSAFMRHIEAKNCIRNGDIDYSSQLFYWSLPGGMFRFWADGYVSRHDSSIERRKAIENGSLMCGFSYSDLFVMKKEIRKLLREASHR